MQKLYTLTLLLLGFNAMAFAQASETFSYDLGATLGGLDGGEGWSAPWNVRKGDDQAAIAFGGVTDIRLGTQTTGPHVAVTHMGGQGGIRAGRTLTTPVTDDGNTYYLGWFQDADYDAPGPNGSVAQVMLLSDANFGASGPGGQLVRMGKLFNTANFGIDGGAVGPAKTIPATDTRMGLFVIVEIAMSGNDDAETLSFYLNPDPTLTTLDGVAPDTFFTANLNTGFDALGFKVEGGADLAARFDEIRFGSTVAEVIPTGLAPGPGLNIDNFNAYAEGTTLNGLDAGLGWGGPWVTVSGDDPVITDGGLQNYDLLAETSGNYVAAEYSGTQGDSRYYRSLNTPFTDDGTRYYFSYSSQSTYTAQADQADFFMFINSAAYAPTGPGGQLLQIGKPLNTPFIGAGFGATPNFEVTGAEATDANFVVIELATSGDADPDTVRLYINPDPNDPVKPAPDAEKLTTRLNDGFDAVGFKVTGLSPGNTMNWDDVFVGRSFSDVLPQDFTAIEPLSDAFALETFNTYEPGDTLGGLDGGSGWAGPWMHAPSSDMSVIQAGGLLNNRLAAGTSGNSLRMTADGTLERSIRVFENPIDTIENADFWFSAHLGANGGAAGTVGNLILVDTTKGNFQQVIVGKQFGTRAIFAVGDGQTGGAAFTGVPFDGTGASFVVGHMEWNEGFWELDLYVDPDPTAEVLTEDTAQVINKQYRSTNFNGIALRVDGGGTELLWDVDDIYFGDTYASVVPDDLVNTTPPPPGAQELFSYDTGSDLEGQDGGDGWSGPWQALTEDNEATIVEEGVAAQALLRATSGSSLELSNYQRLVRPLEGVYGDNGREFWIGWWYQITEPANSIAHLVLADTASYAASGGEGRLVQIGKLFGNTNIGIVAGGASPTTADATAGHFLVARVVTDGTAAPDEVTLWVDPDLSTTPSADTADAVRSADLANWNGMGIIFESDPADDTDMTVNFDDLIVGFTFQEVVPNGLVELEPPNAVRPAVELFDYTVGTDLADQDGGSGWAGAWESVSGSATILEGSVESPRTCPDTTHSANITQSGSDMPTVYRRSFFNPYGTDAAGSTFYASFVLNGVAKDIGNSALVSFVSGDRNILSIGGVPGLSSLAVIPNDSEAPQTSNQLVVQGTKWFVVRMDINPETALATAYVFVDPAGDAIPPDETAVFTVENVSVLDGVTGIEISGEGAQSVSLIVDDIRIGSGYRDISCQFGSDDPNLLAYEPFNYDANTSLIGAGGENAFWNGPWTLGSDQQANTAIVLDGSLDNPAMDSEANRLEMSLLAENEQLRIDRELAFPLESDGRTYWLSFLMNTTDGAAVANVGNVVLRNSDISGFDGQRILFGRIFGEGTLGSAVPGGATRRTQVNDEGQNWMVVRMQTDPTSPVDTFTVWINPPSSASAPDTSSAGFQQYFESPALKEGINTVRVRVEGAGGGQIPYVTEFDEIKLATAWSSIVDLTNSVRQDAIRDDFALEVFPNPTAGTLSVNYRLLQPGPVQLDILNATGRMVYRAPRADQPAGRQRYDFNGGELDGLPNGLYLVRVSQLGRSSLQKVLLLR